MTTKQYCPNTDKKARKIESMIQERLGTVGKKPCYEALAIDKDVFGRFANNQNGIGINEVAKLLAYLDLEVYPRGAVIAEPGCTPVPNKEIVRAFTAVTESLSADSLQYKKWESLLLEIGLIKTDDEGRLMIPLESIR